MNKRYRGYFGLTLILFVFSLVKIIKMYNYHVVGWDESVYLGMGKYMFSWGTAGLWEEIRPVGLPFIFGLIWKLGLNQIFFAELLEVMFAVGNLVVVYLIGKKMFNPLVGTISALFLAVTPAFFNHSSLFFTGIPSTFFALLAVYMFMEKKIFIAGILCATTFMFRFPQGILLAVLAVMILFEKRRFQLLLELGTGFVAIVFPFLVFNYFMYLPYVDNAIEAMFRPFILAAIHQANAVHAVPGLNNLVFYLIELFKNNPLLVFALCGIIFFNRKNKLVYIIPFFYLLYFTYIINKQLRFSLAFLPYICILSAWGVYKLLSKRKLVLKVAGVLVIAILLVFPIKLNLTEYKSRDNEEPAVIKEFYKYFLNKGFNGAVLSTDPRFVAFSDVLLIPYYANVEDAIEIYVELMRDPKYKLEREKIKYIVFTDYFYPCIDEVCDVRKQLLFNRIKGENELVFYKDYYHSGHYVFENSLFNAA